MRIKINLTVPSTQKVNLPCDASITVAQLKETIRKRVPSLPADAELYYDGAKMFDEDTLADLGLAEGAEVSDTDGTSSPDGESASGSNAGIPPPSDVNTPVQPSAPVVEVALPPPRLVNEVLVICFDISSSMGASFVPEISRLAASKVCFGAFIDKTIGFEFPHAIGLITFGSLVHEKLAITRDLNTFEQIFGSATDLQGATYLYPAVKLAVDKIVAYKANSKDLSADAKFRIMCFTDGGDNSGVAAYEVVPAAMKNGIVVDAIIVGGSDSDHLQLRSLAHCTGGMSVRIPQDPASLSGVFENEPVLALSERKADSHQRRMPSSRAEFDEYGDLVKYPYVGVDLKAVQRVADSSVTAKVMTADAIKVIMSQASTGTTDSTTSSVSKGVGGASLKRIMKEYQEILNDANPNFAVFIADGDICHWKALMKGHDKTSYAGGTFLLQIEFPKDYPFSPPKVRFLTPIYHANISDQGRLCLDILKDSWSPALTTLKVLLSIYELMAEPNFSDPLDAWKASVARDNRPQYEQNIKDYTRTHASASMDEMKKLYCLS